MAPDNKYELSPYVRIEFATADGVASFFGYYDKSPLDAAGTRLLAHRCAFDGRDPTAEDEVEVGYYTIPNGAWHPVGRTSAFNWQQGAMLQWLGPDFQSRIIYNVRRENRFASMVFNTAAGSSRNLDFPVYAVHPSGEFALGVNYERFFFFRGGYNYQGVNRPEWNVPLHPKDGIFQVDIGTGAHRLIISTVDVARFRGGMSSGGTHWLEHMMWNPSGSRFIFLHRHGTGAAYTTELFTADQGGEVLYRFPDAELYSHTGWRGDKDFVIYAHKPNVAYQTYLNYARRNNAWIRPIRSMVRAFRKWLIPPQSFKKMTHGFFYLVEDRTVNCQTIGAEHIREDGHPTWTRDGRFMLIDTYADERGYRHLLIYDHQVGQVHELGRFFSPYNSCGYRCDLHPRFSRDERHVIIDSAHGGIRKLYVLKLDWTFLI